MKERHPQCLSFFFMKDKEKSFLKNSDISNLIKSLDGSVKDNVRRTTGMDYKDGLKSNILSDINSINSDFKTNKGNLVDNLIRMQKNGSSIEDRELNRVLEALSSSQNDTMISKLCGDMSGAIGKFADLMMITTIMPQLKDTKNAIVGGILSPDDNTQQLALSLEDKSGRALSESDPEFYKEIKTLLNEKYEIVKNLKKIVSNAETCGRAMVAVESYSDLFAKLIVRDPNVNNETKNKFKLNLVENTEFDISEIEIMNESAMLNTFESSTSNGNVVKEIKSGIKECLDTMIISEGATNLFDKSALESQITKQFKKQSNNKGKVRMGDGLLAKEMLVSDQLKNIKGCKQKILDPRRTIRLVIDDTKLGYIYIENKLTSQALRNPLNHSIRPDINNTDATNSIDSVYQSLGNALLKKLDLKFLEDNAEFKSELYDILKFTYDAKSIYQVTYLKPEDVIEFEIDDGKSPFEGSILYGKLYMQVLLSTIMAKIVRGQDIRAYYVNTDEGGNVSNQVMNAMGNLQRTNRSMLMYNSFQKIMSNSTVFTDLVLTRTNDKNPIDIDVIAGQNVEIPTDVLEMLEKIAVDTTGYPLQLTKSSNDDVDFAKSYETLHIKAMKTVRDHQVDLNPSVTQYIRKILSSHYRILGDERNDKHADIIESLSASFQSPMNLVLTNFMDLISNAKDTATNIAEVVVGTNNTDEDSGVYTDKLILRIVKDLVPAFDFDKYEKIYDQIVTEHKALKQLEGNGEEDPSADDMANDY